MSILGYGFGDEPFGQSTHSTETKPEHERTIVLEEILDEPPITPPQTLRGRVKDFFTTHKRIALMISCLSLAILGICVATVALIPGLALIGGGIATIGFNYREHLREKNAFLD